MYTKKILALIFTLSFGSQLTCKIDWELNNKLTALEYNVMKSFKGVNTSTTDRLAVWFKHASEQPALLERLKKIKLIVSDIDGSLTDGTVEYQEDSEGTRYFSTQDGFATVSAAKVGLSIAFLSGKGAKSGQYRAKILGIPSDLCILGSSDKRVIVAELQKSRGLQSNEILMYGDDFLDAQVKLDNSEIFFVTPANAPFYIQHAANLNLPAAGGEHAFRLLVDLILYIQGRHFAQDLVEKSLKGAYFETITPSADPCPLRFKE